MDLIRSRYLLAEDLESILGRAKEDWRFAPAIDDSDGRASMQRYGVPSPRGGTARLSSSNQFTTTTIRTGADDAPPSLDALIMRKRAPSGDTSYVRGAVRPAPSK